MTSPQPPSPSYDAWLHWETWSPCNFACRYCTSEKNSVREVEIASLIRTLDATGLTFRVSFTGGGEPFLIPNLVETCAALTDRHFVSCNTHLTHPRTHQFIERIDPQRVLTVSASAHLAELDRLGLTQRFIDNFHLFRQHGFDIHTTAVADPPLLGEIDVHRRRFEDSGVDLKFSPFVGRYQGRDYPQAYSDRELSAFGLTREDTSRHLLKGALCNAGYNAVTASPEGHVYSCINAQLGRKRTRRLGHIYHGFDFQPQMVLCPYDVCLCPTNRFDPGLFDLAKARTGATPQPD